MVIGRGVLVENTPRTLPNGLLRVLRNFRLRMRTPKEPRRGQVATVLLSEKTGHAQNILRLKGPTRADVAHAQNILPVAPPQMRFELSPYTTLVRETVHQEMQSVKHNLIPLSETIFSIHKICTIYIRLNNAYYFSTKRLNVRVKVFIHKVFWTFLEGTYFKILQERRHTYPSVTKLHKSTQLLTQSLMFFLTFRCSNLLRI